jgi:hypothetical protein
MECWADVDLLDGPGKGKQNDTGVILLSGEA